MSRRRTLVAWRQPALLISCAMVFLCGCATTNFVKVRHKPENQLAARLNRSLLGFFRSSDRTDQFLAETGYAGGDDLRSMIEHCRTKRNVANFAEATHALAELQYLVAESVRGRDPHLAMELYLDASRDAWKFFSTPDASGVCRDPSAAEYRGTADVYNTSAENLLRLARVHGRFRLGQSLQMPITHRMIHFEAPFSTGTMSHQQFGDFDFVSDYQLKNLRNRHKTSGLGVPVIVAHHRSAIPDPMEKYYTQSMNYAATLVFRFDELEATSGSAPIRLQVYDPRESEGMVVAQTLLPLETDVSTPLARQLSNPDLSLLDTWGLIRPDLAEKVEGLYMVQPFDPDRIPVLMVHGFWSSPMTWMEMFNELQADPEIRRKYQFWFYLYPTGEPIAFSAARLRDKLAQMRLDCDPTYSNSRLDQMVVVGHSMGGILAHMLTIDSGDRLWKSVSPRPVDALTASSSTKAEIRRVFFFRHNSSVDRIVTIASPYEGSSLSNRFTRWALGSVIWLPSRTMELSRVIFDQNKSDHSEGAYGQQTSIDSLTRKSAVLRLVRSTKVPDEIPHHNIVAIRKGKDPLHWTDGVVSFSSAHREDVTSEKVIHAGHSEVVRHSETAREIRRILQQHLLDVQKGRFPVIPVQQTVDDPDVRVPPPLQAL
jgi:pimeloyl-ACP methyl ester carboxylesterase